MFPTQILAPGDCLLYGVENAWFSRPFESLVQLVTRSPVYHCEIYIGDGKSLSADYRGVNIYPLNTGWEDTFVRNVMRARRPLNLKQGLAWFETVRGQQYDAMGLVFFGKHSDPNRKICSELAVLYYDACGYPVFPEKHPKSVTPGHLLGQEYFKNVWQRA